MKESILYILLSLLIFSSCNDRLSVGGPDLLNKDIIFFSCSPEDFFTIKTKADVLDEYNLFLFCFDENGSFMSVVKAQTSGPEKYSAVIDNASKVKLVHFMALPKNDSSPIQELILFSQDYIGKDEREVMNRYSTDKIAFWRRKNFTSGLYQGLDVGKIELLRNQASIIIEKSSDLILPDGVSFSIVGWALYGYPNVGTYAPFDSEGDTFPNSIEEIDNRTITIPSDIKYVYPAAASYLFYSRPSFLFERKQSFETDPFYIILKAKYGRVGYEKECYYKVQLSDNMNLELVDIVRNYLYIITIKEVAKIGATTVQEALDGIVANDATISIALSFYNKITNGHETLELEKTAYVFCYPNRDFKMFFTYSNITNSSPPPQVNVIRDVLIDKAFAAGTLQVETINTSQWSSNGRISGIISGKVTDYIPLLGDINTKFSIRIGNLVRDVRIRVGQPLHYIGNPTFEPDVVGNEGLNSVYSLNFRIPANIDRAIFPIKFYVDAKIFSPTDNMLSEGKLYIEYLGRDYRYVYTSNHPGDNVSLKFRRNMTNVPGILTLLSANFVGVRFISIPQGYTEISGDIVLLTSNNIEVPVPQNANVFMYPIDITKYGFKIIGEKTFSLIHSNNISNSQVFKFIYNRTDGTSLTVSYTLSQLQINKKITFIE